MKAFWLKKSETKEDGVSFRGESIDKNSIEVNINEENFFNNIKFTNYKFSNCIYTIHSLQFKTIDKNILTLFMADHIDFKDNINSKDNLHIEYNLDNTGCSSSIMELCSFRTDMNSKIDLLSYNYLLLLPGGSIIVKLNSPIKKGLINITFSIENF